MNFEKADIRKYMVKANEQIKPINTVFVMSFILKLLIKKRKQGQNCIRQYYVQGKYLLFCKCLCPLKVYGKYRELFQSICSKLEIGNTDIT